MATLRFTTIVPYPTDEVFAIVADLSQDPRWRSHISGSELVEGESAERSVYRQTHVEAGQARKVTVRVAEVVEGRRVRSAVEGGSVPFEETFEVEAEGDGTLLTLEAKADVPSWLATISNAVLARDLDGDWQKLRELLAERRQVAA